MKKNLFLFLLAAGIAVPAWSDDDVVDLAADKTCSCIENKMDEPGYDPSQMELVLGLCVIQATSPLKAEIYKAYKLDVSRSKDLEKVSKMIGERAVFRCQRFTELVMGIVAEEEAGKKPSGVPPPPPSYSRELIGKVEAFECNDICKIVLKEGTRSYTIYLTNGFDGLELVKKGDMLKGESVRLTVEEMDLYSQDTKGMVSVYVLLAIASHTE